MARSKRSSTSTRRPAAGKPARQRPSKADHEAADRLHSAAIHMLRRLRALDEATGISGPRLSALSVIVFAGPVTITQLANAEQVRPATISRMVKELEYQGLVRRETDRGDRRVQNISATAAGRELLQEGRRRRVDALSAMLARLPAGDRDRIGRAARLIEKLA